MRVRAGVATDIGRVREGNEDSYLSEEPLFAVADGMGGHKGGEVASHLALETLEVEFREGKNGLAQQIKDANAAVFERSQADTSVKGMGTTLTAVVVEGGSALFAHVGDSRAYLLRADDLRQLTDDHTLVARMVKSGEISEAEAEVHPHRSVLTRALGTEPDVAVDEFDVALTDGDRLLLCSDGLTGMVTEEQIAAILSSAAEPQDAADRLVRAANRAGGVDNITVVVIDVEAEPGEDADAPAGRSMPNRRRMLGIAGKIALVLLVLAVALIGVRVYVDRQWYVGVADDRVSVFRGIPAEFAGLRFSHPVVITEIPAADALALPIYTRLPDGLTANDRDGALMIVEQIRRDVANAAEPPPEPGGGGGGTGGGGTGGGGGGGTGGGGGGGGAST